MEDGAKMNGVRVNNFALERLENCGKRGWKIFFYFLIIICIFMSNHDYILELFQFIDHK